MRQVVVQADGPEHFIFALPGGQHVKVDLRRAKRTGTSNTVPANAAGDSSATNPVSNPRAGSGGNQGGHGSPTEGMGGDLGPILVQPLLDPRKHGDTDDPLWHLQLSIPKPGVSLRDVGSRFQQQPAIQGSSRQLVIRHDAQEPLDVGKIMGELTGLPDDVVVVVLVR